MKFNQCTHAAAAIAAIGVWSITPGAQGAIADLTTGGSATINSGIFQTINFQPAGTGVIQPFVRLQEQGNNTYEAGYNTSLGTPLDVLSSGQAWHTDLQLSSLQTVTVNGINYYDFRLDLNQSSGQGSSLLSLNQVEIFGASSAAPASGVGMDSTTGRATSPTLLGTLLWDMNPGGGTANGVLLDYDLNKGGSGQGDMELLVPTSALSQGYSYLVFYSQFGSDPVALRSSANDGFEEWAALAVPEPATITAGLLLLLPFGISITRLLCKTRNPVV